MTQSWLLTLAINNEFDYSLVLSQFILHMINLAQQAIGRASLVLIPSATQSGTIIKTAIML